MAIAPRAANLIARKVQRNVESNNLDRAALLILWRYALGLEGRRSSKALYGRGSTEVEFMAEVIELETERLKLRQWRGSDYSHFAEMSAIQRLLGKRLCHRSSERIAEICLWLTQPI